MDIWRWTIGKGLDKRTPSGETDRRGLGQLHVAPASLALTRQGSLQMQTGMNRRHFLKHVAGASALALPSMSFMQGLRAAEDELKKENKSLIILWMGGGPSHMDLWDLKPGEPTGGEFKPIKTAASGIKISEVLPTVAGQMKHLSIVRSLVTNEGSHERGTVLMNTGRQPNPVVHVSRPSAPSPRSQLTPKELPLPGFIGVGGTAQRIGPGFLGMTYAPFTVQNAGQPPANIKAPAGLGASTMEMERLAAASACSTPSKSNSPNRIRTGPPSTCKKPRTKRGGGRQRRPGPHRPSTRKPST